ncbi:hypothetical protein ACGFRB_02390 [Streptomyces sp. NPDC048718]|uniref:hypothetical protein n=1 Tax=Streptomyces sp. NPDC048718 TaxID=3365587 RepID=UPI003713D3DD
MPGQRKRKQRQRAGARRAAERYDARFGPEAGRWEVRFGTSDEGEWRSHLAQFLATEPQLNAEDIRIDRYCGRLVTPDYHQLSVFVRHDRPAAAPSADEHEAGAPGREVQE